jgi:hypothetical protein
MSEDEGVVVYSAGQAAKQLGVSGSGLRRLAAAYETVFNELPRQPGTKARGYPEEAVERIRSARRGVESGQYKSVEAALSALKKGVHVDSGAEMDGAPDAGSQAASELALGVLAEEMRAMRTELERLRSIVEVRNPSALPPGENVPAPEHGPLVRFALWLERFLRRSG